MAGNSFLALFLFLFCILWTDSVKSEFTFEVKDSPTQCGPVTVTWTGGVPPFRLIVVVPTENSLNITIPDSSFQNGQGSYTLPQLQVPTNKQILFAMSDATGGTSGGTTNLMGVGNASPGSSCNSTLPANDFIFVADDTLTQCSKFLFQQFEGAQLPITIYAWIPGGSNSFIVPVSPPDAASFSWTANVTAQSQIIFSVIDSKGRLGGTDRVRIVAGSNDNDKSCITAKPGSPNNGNNSGNPGSNENTSETKEGISTGAIAGIAIAAALVIGLLGGLLFWLTKRRNNRYDGPRPLNLADEGDYSRRPPPDSSYPMLTPFTASPTTPGRQQEFDPYSLPPPPPPAHGSQGHTPSEFLSPTSTGTFPTSTTQYRDSTGSSSAAITSSSRKFIVHRDIDDTLEEPEDLPPSYVDRRPPNASTSVPRKN